MFDRLGKARADQVTGEGEYVALGIRQWIEPARTAMDDDDDLARGAAVFHRPRRALLGIDRPSLLFKHGGASDLVLELFDLVLVHFLSRAP